MNNDMHEFEQFMKQRAEASQAFVDGDIAPLHRISTHVLSATFFSPNGDVVQGADEVNEANASGAKLFRPGSKNSFEIMQMAANDGIGYWTGMQHSTVRMQGQAEPITMNLRVTEIFRHEADGWKLVHRHADALQSEPKEKHP